MVSIFNAAQQSFYFLTYSAISYASQWLFQTFTTLSKLLIYLPQPTYPHPSYLLLLSVTIPLQKKTGTRLKPPQCSLQISKSTLAAFISIHFFFPITMKGMSLLLLKANLVFHSLDSNPPAPHLRPRRQWFLKYGSQTSSFSILQHFTNANSQASL